MTLLVSVNGVDVSSFTESIVRDVSMCEVSCGLALQLDPRAPIPDPYQDVTVDVDGVRRFTGSVNSTSMRRSGGKWVMQVTCDHYALKRLKDYFYHETFNTCDSDYVIGALIGYIATKAGVTINWVSGTADALVPRRYIWTDVTLMSFLMDLALFGELQIAPQDDGTLLMTKAVASGTVYTDLSPIMRSRERRLDDSMYRTMVMIFGNVAAYRTFGNNPYGYTRAAIVSDFLIQTNEKAKEIGDRMITEFNRLLDVEKTTIPGRWNIPIASTARVSDARDGYDNFGIVTRLNDTYNSEGYQEVITTNERCPKIYGFEYYNPYHDVVLVVMHNHKHVLKCANIKTLTEPAVWEEITPGGFDPLTDTVCSLALDPDYKGAWLVTKGTAPTTTTGVFRSDDITIGGFGSTPKLSQYTAATSGSDYKLSLGLVGIGISFGEVRSCISFGNGSTCVPEVAWSGFFDRAPTAVFVSTDSGTSWTIRVPYYTTNPPPSNSAFWCEQYNERGCHQIDWDGSELTIAGLYKGPSIAGATVTSSDGLTWTLTPYSLHHGYFRSTNVIGDNVFAREEAALAEDLLILPDIGYAYEGGLSMGFRRTVRDNHLVDIRHVVGSTTYTTTELYEANVLALTSGGEALTVSVVNGGSGYSLGDILTLAVPEGGTSATVTVSGVTGTIVNAVTLTTPGSGYITGTYATTGGGGAGCTIGVTTDAVPPFGIAKILADGEFITVAKSVVDTGEVVTYIAGVAKHDRTGNLLSLIGSWEGTMSDVGNSMDSSGLEIFTYSVAGRE